MVIITYVEFLGVHLWELLEGECPPVESGSESDWAVLGVDADHAHGSVVVGVGGDDDVDVLDDTGEGLVQLFGVQLELQKGAVHLVHEKDGPDTLGDGLTQDSLGLVTHACKGSSQRGYSFGIWLL